jgi:hypothetical protein
MALHFYLGSTYSDLKDYREAAIDAVRTFSERSKEHYVDYEVFDPNALPHEGQALLDTCLSQVNEASYFILLLGWRYGYVPDGSELSIIELEFNAAVEAGIPRFCFVIDDRHPVSPRHVETGEGAEKLRRFKARVESEHIVARFTTPDDLARQLITSSLGAEPSNGRSHSGSSGVGAVAAREQQVPCRGNGVARDNRVL